MKTKTITTDNFKTYECNIKLIADNPKLKLIKETFTFNEGNENSWTGIAKYSDIQTIEYLELEAKMQLNEMLNRKLKDDIFMVSNWKAGKAMVILEMDNFDDLDVIKAKLENSLIFRVEQVGIQLWVRYDNLFKQLYLNKEAI